jgi:hypothetical protein
MRLVLEIKNLNELQLLLQYLRLLPSAKVVKQVADSEPAAPTNGKTSFFDKYNASIQSNTSIEEINAQLQTLRKEWERDTW